MFFFLTFFDIVPGLSAPAVDIDALRSVSEKVC